MKIMNGIFKNNVFYLIIFFCIVFLATLILNNYYSKKEFSEEIYFTVYKVEETPALRCYYYGRNGSKLILNSHIFYAPSEIQRGDIITKKANSNQLVIYRYDSSGQKEIYQTINIK